jgi:uncharacterized protein YuzE
MAKIIKQKSKKIVHYDQKTDVLYVRFHKRIEKEFVEVFPGINVELDSEGKIIGIEILNASKILKPVIDFNQKKVVESKVK